MTYVQLKRMFVGMDAREKNQLIDYIIVRYNIIRYDDLTTKCYDGYENMLIAINSNAGSEYEVQELRYGRSDAEYRYLYKYVHKKGFKDAGEVISLPSDSKYKLLVDMMNETSVSKLLICKFLHFAVALK